MQKYRLLIFVLVLVGAEAVCHAYALNPAPALGIGNISCGQWLSHRETQDNDARIVDSWLMGFFSGRNVFDRLSKSMFLSPDEPHLLDAVSVYCRSHKSTSVYEAATAFIAELRMKPRR
jgi:hypothetical protein